MRKIRLLDNVYDLITINMEDRFKDCLLYTSCGAAMFDPKILSDMMEKGFFGAQMYGLTETCGRWCRR